MISIRRLPERRGRLERIRLVMHCSRPPLQRARTEPAKLYALDRSWAGETRGENPTSSDLMDRLSRRKRSSFRMIALLAVGKAAALQSAACIS